MVLTCPSVGALSSLKLFSLFLAGGCDTHEVVDHWSSCHQPPDTPLTSCVLPSRFAY